jgi:hypothetical protein
VTVCWGVTIEVVCGQRAPPRGGKVERVGGGGGLNCIVHVHCLSSQGHGVGVEASKRHEMMGSSKVWHFTKWSRRWVREGHHMQLVGWELQGTMVS